MKLPSPECLALLMGADLSLACAALLLAYQEALRELEQERVYAKELDRLLTTERAWKVTP